MSESGSLEVTEEGFDGAVARILPIWVVLNRVFMIFLLFGPGKLSDTVFNP